MPTDADNVCTCGHLAANHPDDNEPKCQVCDCEWYYAGREDW